MKKDWTRSAGDNSPIQMIINDNVGLSPFALPLI